MIKVTINGASGKMGTIVSNLIKNDNFLVAIDPFNNMTTGFAFGLNAYGAQWDGTMYDGGRVDLNWDTKWVSEVTFDKDRWICEISICKVLICNISRG